MKWTAKDETEGKVKRNWGPSLSELVENVLKEKHDAVCVFVPYPNCVGGVHAFP